MPYLLLAMQAAGMVTDYLGALNQDQLMKEGAASQQAAIESNIHQLKLESENESLQNLKKLRQTLGAQIAVMAARGTSTGAGSALGILNESQANFNSDERIRKLNLLGKEKQLRAGQAISKLQYSSDSAKLWQSFSSRTINRFPTSKAGLQAYGFTSIDKG